MKTDLEGLLDGCPYVYETTITLTDLTIVATDATNSVIAGDKVYNPTTLTEEEEYETEFITICD